MQEFSLTEARIRALRPRNTAYDMGHLPMENANALIVDAVLTRTSAPMSGKPAPCRRRRPRKGDHVHRFVSAMMGRYMPLQVGCSLVELVEPGTTGS